MDKNYRTQTTVLFFLLVLLVVVPEVLPQEKAIIKKGDNFPEIALAAPVEPEHFTYLGIEKGESFSLGDIRADYILAEIMNINCSSCQRQAPMNNKLYSLIESTPETRGRLKMFAIAVGCLDLYIKEFVAAFKTPYPVIEDPKFVIYDLIGRSPIPLALLVKRDPVTGEGVVVWTHSGFDSDYEGMFEKIKGLMDVDLASVREEGKEIKARTVEVKPVITEDEFKETAKAAFAKEGDQIRSFEKIRLKTGRTVYFSEVRQNEKSRSLFAVLVSRPVPCDVCHDVHFIYVFEASGKILQLIPVQLTKYGNKHWDASDVEKMRSRIIGRYMGTAFEFDPEIDAITTATITSSVIFKSLEEEQALFKELKEKDLIH